MQIAGRQDCIRAAGLKHVLCVSWRDDNVGECLRPNWGARMHCLLQSGSSSTITISCLFIDVFSPGTGICIVGVSGQVMQHHCGASCICETVFVTDCVRFWCQETLHICQWQHPSDHHCLRQWTQPAQHAHDPRAVNVNTAIAHVSITALQVRLYHTSICYNQVQNINSLTFSLTACQVPLLTYPSCSRCLPQCGMSSRVRKWLHPPLMTLWMRSTMPSLI